MYVNHNVVQTQIYLTFIAVPRLLKINFWCMHVYWLEIKFMLRSASKTISNFLEPRSCLFLKSLFDQCPVNSPNSGCPNVPEDSVGHTTMNLIAPDRKLSMDGSSGFSDLNYIKFWSIMDLQARLPSCTWTHTPSPEPCLFEQPLITEQA